MSFDIDLVMCEMLNAIKNTLDGNWFDVKSTVKQVLENEKDALEHLAEERFLKNISEEDFSFQLQDELDEIVAEIIGQKLLSKDVAHKAAQAAIDKFFSAIQAA
jgi:hypothetical protein